MHSFELGFSIFAYMKWLLFIHWNADPEIFSIGPFTIRWYGLLFALGFFIGQFIMAHIYRLEGKPQADLEKLLLYMIISTVVGARLGHCLFYQPDYYLAHPIDILKIWEGGLASHGAAIGILLGLWLYSRKRPDQPYIWLLDRIVIVVALGGGLIRIGNLMNSEIIGKPTTLPWAFIFHKVDELPRHPAQLYEAISCLILFTILYRIYMKYKEKTPQGRLFGIFVWVVFGLRIGYEFIKENQVPFEENLPLNMGQLLSIPLVAIGLWIYARSFRAHKAPA
ncbi:MAG: prolipoprotein diacylglyceryl transferase [Cytophagales bacterium]|nr:prolipoprotein diacylglyceryl transferase [Bernardetiaceae bacterium]MDW8210590.1 prolipoprotein diacylglyceryl transferase [Cytophagales bacterium]